MEGKFLIIGSNSFSGSNFCSYLLTQGKEVIGVSRSDELDIPFLNYKKNKNYKNFSFYRIDLNKNLSELVDLIKNSKPDFIINFAAQGMVAESWITPQDWYITNIVSQSILINEIKNFSFIKKFIQFSTPEVYGNNNDWISESFNFNPSTPYAISRAAIDTHLKCYNEAYNFPVIFTRAANVYGPGQQLYRIIPKTILSIKTKQKLPLHGAGKTKRSFIHINDVSEALFAIIQRGKLGETYHISTNIVISIAELVNKICSVLSYDSSDLIEMNKERIGKDFAYLLSTNKLREELGWEEKINLEEGINMTIQWIEENFEEFKFMSMEYNHKE